MKIRCVTIDICGHGQQVKTSGAPGTLCLTIHVQLLQLISCQSSRAACLAWRHQRMRQLAFPLPIVMHQKGMTVLSIPKTGAWTVLHTHCGTWCLHAMSARSPDLNCRTK